MIGVQRGPVPAYLSGDEARRIYEEAARYYRTPAANRDQRRREFTGQHPDVDLGIYQAFRRKCAYCESAVDMLHVGLHRPRSNAAGRGGTSPDHYWWLAWEWRNMYLVCAACLRAKGSAFPVDGQRALPEEPYERVAATERAMLLDPCAEEPEGLLLFDDSGRVVATDLRAMTTIDVIGLNRQTLVQRRRQEAARVRGQLAALDGLVRAHPGVIRSDFGTGPDQEPWRTLRELISTATPFAALRRQLVRSWWDERGDRIPADDDFRSFLNRPVRAVTPARLAEAWEGYREFLRQREAATLDDQEPDDRLYMKTRFVESIELHNVRTFEHLEIRIESSLWPEAPCLAILGENGTGKTTILQAVALALMGAKERRRLRLRPSSFLRAGAAEAWIRLRLTGSEEPYMLHFRRGHKEFRELGHTGPQVPVMAYGPTRLLPGRGSGKFSSRAARIDNLFRPRTALTSPAAWLARLADQDRFRKVARDLRSLLPLNDDDEIERGPPVRARLAGDRVTFSQLSAGYQAILALATDVMRFTEHLWGAHAAGELSATVRGILIIDELDAHLHPRWKIRVLSDLRRIFPQVQIIVTTHDPLVLRSLAKGEAVTLGRNGRNEVVPEMDLPSPQTLRIDQLLTSEFFGLVTTTDPATDQLFRDYQRLLTLPHRRDADEAQLRTLERELDTRNLLGGDARERVMLRAIDTYLGRNRGLLGAPALSRDATDAVERELADLWDAVKVRSDDD